MRDFGSALVIAAALSGVFVLVTSAIVAEHASADLPRILNRTLPA